MPKENFRLAVELFLVSLLGLFLEMACIRWIPAQVRVLAYYTNIVLLAAFFGWGLGYMLAPIKKKLLYTFPFVLLLNITVCYIFSKHSIEVEYGSQVYFWQTIMTPLAKIQLKWFLPFFFVLISFLFIPIGQQSGRLFDKLPPVYGYTVNILGSVTGILLYSLLSYNLMPPIWLFAIFLALYTYFFLTQASKLLCIITVVIFCVVLVWVYQIDKFSFWSPYYKIEIDRLNHKEAKGFTLTVNNDYHQMAMDLSTETINKISVNRQSWQEWARLYELPYRIHSYASDVLVVGAGTGNDVSAALRMGVKRIDAVDIDPLILKIGAKKHPEKPYSDSRVHRYVDDARSFFRKTDRKYDIIVFGFLDSHQLFSSMSDLRLDNYVYTVQSIKEAKALLKPGGIIALTFCVTKDWIGNRLYQIMKKGTGEPPLILSSGKEPNGWTYVYGLKTDDLKGYDKVDPSIFGTDEIKPTTDNWPFFYLKDKKIPFDYFIVIVSILIISIAGITVTGTDVINRFQPTFFFLGAGFLLFETKSITQMSLLFGSTWIVNSMVFTAIFITILIGNLYYSLFKVQNIRIYYLLLFISLAVNYFFPLKMILYYGLFLKSLMAGILIGLPIFFSGIIFIKKFSDSPQKSAAMGANLLGSMIGGVMEYSGMVVGFKNLIFIVGLFYLFSIFQFKYKK